MSACATSARQLFHGILGSGILREHLGIMIRAIGKWIAEYRREALRRESIEGCREMAGLYLEIEREWNHAADEAWRTDE
jgi:hypothetical protein